MPINFHTRVEIECNRCHQKSCIDCGQNETRHDIVRHCENLGWKVIHPIEQGDPEIVFCPSCKSVL